MWEKIIECYRALPEDTRTAQHVAAKLQSQGDSISPCRVRDVLQATVLEEISADAIRTTAHTLKMLLDVSDNLLAEPASAEQRFTAHILGPLWVMDHGAYGNLKYVGELPSASRQRRADGPP